MKRIEAFRFAHLIARVAHSGNPGDGIVVVAEVTQVLRIRSAIPASGASA